MLNTNSRIMILFRGLGGCGKTSISTKVSKHLRIPLLNRDDIKPLIRNIIKDEKITLETSYAVMNTLAEIQIKNGVSVILDANARFKSMESYYQSICDRYNAIFIAITCICTNQDVWQRRIINRGSQHSITFQETREMHIESFSIENQLTIDTASFTANQASLQCIDWLKNTNLINT